MKENTNNNYKKQLTMHIVTSTVLVLVLTSLLILGVNLMKSNKSLSIVGIIVSSILILLLTAALIIGINISNKGGFSMSNGFSIGGLTGFSGDNGYSTDALPDDLSGVSEINIGWACGRVDIKCTDTSGFDIFEEGTTDKYKLCWKLDGGKLSLRYCKSLPLFAIDLPDKTLNVTLPVSIELDKVKVSNASAKVFIDGVTANEIKIDTASGGSETKRCTADMIEIDSASGKTIVSDCKATKLSIDSASGSTDVTNTSADTIDIESASGSKTLTGCSCTKLKTDSASGSLKYEGSAEEIECDSAAGSITLTLDNRAKSIDVDSASGSTKVYLPSDAGFDAKISAASGKIKCDFADAKLGDKYAFRSGAYEVKIEVSCASGSLTIAPKD